MEIINLNWPLTDNKINTTDKVIAMGLFDGLHLGHQTVIKKAREVADQNQLPLAVLTYYPSPSTFFGDPDRKLLTSNQEKINRLNEISQVDYLYITNINQSFLNLKPQDFVDQFLLKLHPKFVVAGSDHTYGDINLKADMSHLPDFAHGSFQVVSVDLLTNQDNQKFASTKIREALATGDIQTANRMLDYHYSITGKVIDGEKVGRTLGFPTVNLNYDQDKIIPADGVYVTQTNVLDQTFNSVTSIGTNPTFKGRQRTVETYILDFDQDIYYQQVQIDFFERIRGQIKFNGLDELIKKINHDVDFARSYFAKLEN